MLTFYVLHGYSPERVELESIEKFTFESHAHHGKIKELLGGDTMEWDRKDVCFSVHYLDEQPLEPENYTYGNFLHTVGLDNEQNFTGPVVIAPREMTPEEDKKAKQNNSSLTGDDIGYMRYPPAFIKDMKVLEENIANGVYQEDETECNRRCYWCRTRDPNAKVCASCSLFFYCSKECQLAHWNTGEHKHLCKGLREQRKRFELGFDASQHAIDTVLEIVRNEKSKEIAKKFIQKFNTPETTAQQIKQ